MLLSLLDHLDIVLLLPVIHFGLFGLVLLEELIQDLFQSVRIGLERRNHILDSPFDQDAVNHPEAFSILGKRLEGLNYEFVLLSLLFDVTNLLRKLLQCVFESRVLELQLLLPFDTDLRLARHDGQLRSRCRPQ